MRAMSCLFLSFAFCAHAVEHDAITLQIKFGGEPHIIIRLLENQKYQSYMTDEINLREYDLPEHFSKENFAEVWKLAEAAAKDMAEGSFQLSARIKESFDLSLRMNGQLRTYNFRPDATLPKPHANLERVRQTLSGLTKW